MAVKCSLLVLTYNQEDFVAEAVNAALAQTYVPLEIVISDDCSTDRTFEIAQACVAGYDGPHDIVLNRNARNLGVIAHTNTIVNRARGDILIPAYGDDVSYPDRVTRIAACFEAQDPLLVHSHADAIDATGTPCVTAYRRADFFRTTEPLTVATSLAHYLGASGGWARELFDKYGPLPDSLVFDDHILGFRAALEGRVGFVDAPLLAYRDGVGLSHAKRAQPDRAQNRAQRRKLLRQAIAVYTGRLADAKRFGLDADHPVRRRLARAIRTATTRLAYYDGGALRVLVRHPLGAGQAWLGEALRDLRMR